MADVMTDRVLEESSPVKLSYDGRGKRWRPYTVEETEVKNGEGDLRVGVVGPLSFLVLSLVYRFLNVDLSWHYNYEGLLHVVYFVALWKRRKQWGFVA